MAIRGKVKDIKSQPMGKSSSGIVTDTSTKIDYQFEQPYATELGLVIGSVVQFETVNAPDGSTWAVALDPIEKGNIDIIDPTTGTGTIVDKSGVKLQFTQNFSKELGLVAAAKVKFATVNVGGVEMATSVRLA